MLRLIRCQGSPTLAKLVWYSNIFAYGRDARHSNVLDMDAVTSAVKKAESPAPIKPKELIRMTLIAIDSRTLERLTKA